MEKKQISKKWIIVVLILAVIGSIGAIFFYEKTSTRVFTKSEYIKEVIVQNQDFESALDSFLDQVASYNGSASSTEKLENTASKFPEFVKDLEEKLGPRVPHESKSHYTQMISAYKIYLEAIDMYKRYVPKNPGDERSALIKEADSKLAEAYEAMKNIK